MGKQVIRGPQGELTLVGTSKPGRVKVDKRKGLLVRLPPELQRRFAKAMASEAKGAPAFSAVPSANATIVGLIAEYVSRWEGVEASPEARHARKVLKGARRV